MKKILIATSVGDEEFLFNIAKRIQNQINAKIYFLLHPCSVFFAETEGKVIVKKSNSIKITKQKFYHCDLVICNYSTLALEALSIGIPALRIMDKSQPPICSGEDGVRYFYDIEKLLGQIEKNKKIKKRQIQKTIKKFFYKLNKKAGNRLWQGLKDINKTYQETKK